MGGSRQKKGTFSVFTSMFKSRKTTSNSNGNYEAYSWEEAQYRSRKLYPSDEDSRYCWVAEPGIDHRASAFIAKFHETRRSEVQTMFN